MQSVRCATFRLNSPASANFYGFVGMSNAESVFFDIATNSGMCVMSGVVYHGDDVIVFGTVYGFCKIPSRIGIVTNGVGGQRHV